MEWHNRKSKRYHIPCSANWFTRTLTPLQPSCAWHWERCFSRTERRRCWAGGEGAASDRKSTRLNSSHLGISYAVFCLKKKNGDVSCPLFATGAGVLLPCWFGVAPV